MHPIHLPAGATIFRAGDTSDAVYLIEDGEIAITVAGGLEVARLAPGELFGESGVLEARPRAATATAIVPTTLLATQAETFLHAFGMDNDRALSLVKLLCRRLRNTSLRTLPPPLSSPEHPLGGVTIRLLPGTERLSKEFAMAPVEVRHLPFQVGNRFGGETLEIASNHTFSIPARGDAGLGAPHFEILRRDGQIGVRDLGAPHGTIINGVAANRTTLNAVVPLKKGDNEVIAGRPNSPFRFHIILGEA